VSWFTSLPPAQQAIAILTAFAALLLAAGGLLSKRPAGQQLLGLLGLALATVPAWSAPGSDGLAVIGTAALAAIALLLLPATELEYADQRLEVGGLLLLGAAGGIALATSSQLLAVILGLETLSLAVAVLCALGRGPRPLEAAFKFFVLAALSLATLVYAAGLFAFATGSFELGAAAKPEYRFLYQVAEVLLVLGLAFELAVVPVHFGALGTYLAAPAGFAGFAMTASKLGAGLALLRVSAALDPAIVGPLLITVGIASIVWATLAGLAQTDLRGILAYSAVAHAGFLALAIGSGPAGRTAAVFYVVVYAASSALVFAALSDRGTGPIPLRSLREQPLPPWRALALVAGLLSLAGMPPSPGLWAKIGVLMPAWQTAGPWLTAVAALGGVFGALYYLRPLPDLLAGMRRRTGTGSMPSAGFALLLAGVAVMLLTVVPWLGTALAQYAPR
jgi:NADH-quinone oxidoreductase subunit N